MATPDISVIRDLVKVCEWCGDEYAPRRKRFRLADWQAQRFCSQSCSGKGGPNKPIVAVDLRFWTKVDKTPGQGPKGECWQWTAAVTEFGYGVFLDDVIDGRRSTNAHRVAYRLATGVNPGELDVCHRCDNPPCVRPDHLFLGVHADNMADMAQKLRSTVGERHPKAKLTDAQVRAIRSDTRFHRVIAAEYGISVPGVTNIINRKTWRHI